MIYQQKQICNIYQLESSKFDIKLLEFIKTNIIQTKNYLIMPTTEPLNVPFVEEHKMLLLLFQTLVQRGFTHLMIIL